MLEMMRSGLTCPRTSIEPFARMHASFLVMLDTQAVDLLGAVSSLLQDLQLNFTLSSCGSPFQASFNFPSRVLAIPLCHNAHFINFNVYMNSFFALNNFLTV
jgi:hypothetical protein